MLELILDTDIGTDVDDALALAFAVRHPDVRLRAVTTVSGDTRRRAHLAATLLRLAGREDIEVAAGLAAPPPGGRNVELGHEGEGVLGGGPLPPLSRRSAVDVLLGAAEGTVVATVGMQTNVAAAVERDPALVRRLRLGVMGGVFARVDGFAPPDDHNLNADPEAAVRALGAGFPILYAPGDVTVRTLLTTRQVDALRRGDALCGALAQLVDRWTPVLHRRRPGLPAGQASALHDPLTVAALVDRRFVRARELPVTVALMGDRVRTFVDPIEGRAAEVLTDVDPAGFAAFWLETVLGGG